MVHLHEIANLKPHDKKKWFSSQSLNYDVAMSAQLLQTKDPVLEFCDDCFANRSSKEASRSISNLFHSSF